ncbi:phospholipid transport system substrate-binding protein [Bathymodiolus japonicus methanotrophic gill symbiont]|uniref:MlaC/ttg2D family ABC transporter substrate-binding protein n=1 Tax=Bathymodiolus japonicus methanotrophic gill symbiont TaxID=113269 RepID=UPI001B760CB3|nr:ABC transporter substrate-binding protein [Bathymodiolus japonicus methanotrophic gill symbiont]GFO71802.1 phospholipid transport system substrate-binding protein [Bathymodiolus japonicus methanotrophic gill symbiont]
MNTMTTHKLARTLLLGFFFLLGSIASAATEKLQPPQMLIDLTSQALLAKLKDPAFASNKTEIRAFVDQSIFPNIDTVRMSALVLGKHWRKASKQQKKQFIEAFKTLLVNTYSTTFTEQFDDWSIKYLPLKLHNGDKTTTVKTIVSQPGKANAKIDYAMVLRNGRWKIYDLKVEGISLVISNRETFSQMIKDSRSLDKVIAELEAKNNKL